MQDKEEQGLIVRQQVRETAAGPYQHCSSHEDNKVNMELPLEDGHMIETCSG
jgi:hypothetical protein